MYILTVAPIARGALQESLTYFSKQDAPVGAVIMIPVRSREIPGIVLEAKPASDAKSVLKKSDYALRKIASIKPIHVWTPQFIKAVKETADYSAQRFGETLLALTPKAILEASVRGEILSETFKKTNRQLQKSAIEGPTSARIDYYQRIIRDALAQNKSVFLCLPTTNDVERMSAVFAHEHKGSLFSFHSGITTKRCLKEWQNATQAPQGILVIGTAQYLNIPRDFSIIILDEEHSPSWKTIVRPLIDLRMFVEKYAEQCGNSLILGGSILRTETHARITAGVLQKITIAPVGEQQKPVSKILNPRTEEKELREKTGARSMVLLTKELIDLIESATQNKEHILLITARKGLSPITSCGDCGTVIECPTCKTPLTLHQKKCAGALKNFFVCHGCSFTREPEDDVHETCPNCGGWKLEGMGIGIDRVSAEIAERFPRTPLFVLDGNKATTKAQAKKIIAEFQKTPGSILLATPMAIPFIDTIQNTAIVSIDSLFAIPNIRMSERIFALMLALSEKTTGALLVQTRTEDTEILEQALAGDILPFIENELSLRKMFFYPPYGTIIKITLQGKQDEIAHIREHTIAFLSEYPLTPSNTITREPKNIFRTHILIKLDTSSCPNKKLLAQLLALPREAVVEVNPDNIL